MQICLPCREGLDTTNIFFLPTLFFMQRTIVESITFPRDVKDSQFADKMNRLVAQENIYTKISQSEIAADKITHHITSKVTYIITKELRDKMSINNINFEKFTRKKTSRLNSHTNIWPK